MAELEPLIAPEFTYQSVTDKISDIVLTTRTPASWLLVASVAFLGVMMLGVSAFWLFARGVGIWGINIPVAWGFAITNFVWWIGIGHAGTLISAILLLLHQKWRNSINRFSEAMTLFAVACAGMFPLMHMGRPWVFYWMFPYPDTMRLWPQFRSPLVWDVFAVSTYGTVSFLFWFLGLVPDLATMRDQAKHKLAKLFYGTLAMGWRGSAKHWARYESAYLILAGLATPLVISVHSVVSMDFAVAQLPGWHSTIFPPYFVAGAIYSGFAMVVSLTIPVRAIYKLDGLITDRHMDYMGKMLLATGMIVAYSYAIEAFTAWYSGNVFELALLRNRAFGPFGPDYWFLILCNLVIPQALWIKKVRQNIPSLWVLSIIINIGMWLERYVIIMTGLSRDFLPSSWGTYVPTVWDYTTFWGTVAFFIFAMCLFIRFLPMISIFESRQLVAESREPGGSPELVAEGGH